MEKLLSIVLQICLGYALGTLTLWGCSKTVRTPHGNLKTAAIYNAVITLGLFTLFAAVFPLGMLFPMLSSLFFMTLAVLYIAGSFWYLMRTYLISIGAALWLYIARWVVQIIVVRGFRLLLNFWMA